LHDKHEIKNSLFELHSIIRKNSSRQEGSNCAQNAQIKAQEEWLVKSMLQLLLSFAVRGMRRRVKAKVYNMSQW
jgi:hypothetical protein